jgi:hypothetical protein
MPDFHWQDTVNNPLSARFPDQAIGIDAWKMLVDRLHGIRGGAPSQLLPVFDQFLQQARSSIPRGSPECRVFVSHRQGQPDTQIAERIAFLASESKLGYWIDVDDPDLRFLDTTPIIPPFRDVLIAAIIEMGLLNSSHVIAAMTQRTAPSKWVPYEIGRAKHDRVYSQYSATWLFPGMQVSDFGEYIHLAEITTNELDIVQWLNATNRACSTNTNISWNRGPTSPLPT